jgi:hypothetical protein
MSFFISFLMKWPNKNASVEQAMCVKQALDMYAQCTGELINPTKGSTGKHGDDNIQ